MKNMTKILAACLLLLAILYNNFLSSCLYFYTKNNKPHPVLPERDPAARPRVLFLPLDSRPPCLDFVRQLGQMGGFDIIPPPARFADNYNHPADYYALRQWLIDNKEAADAAIISLDMLLYGGLIASRRGSGNSLDEESMLKGLEFMSEKQPYLYAFSIIPRLFIAEDDATKLWQYHMMVYSTKKDMEDTFNNPADFNRMWEMLNRVPPELISRFNKLYRQNDRFNKQLARAAQKNFFRQLVVGQDDGQPFGRPNANMHKMDAYRREFAVKEKIALTQGADEIAMLQLACYANQTRKFSPKIKIVYAHNSIPDIVMHFMPVTVEETIREKVALLGGVITDYLPQADFVLFVHCGGEEAGMLDLPQVADTIIQLSREKPLALVDLSVNFFQRETVLGSLLAKDFPLSSLIAYAGWNTSSNSIGSALAQSSLFISQKYNIDKKYWPALYYDNFQFTIARALDDWAYQKDVHNFTDRYLRWKGIDPYRLSGEKGYALEKIQKRMYWITKELFYTNIAKYPFYSDEGRAFYITKLDAAISLPWERTFEIRLDLKTEAGQTIVKPP